MLLWVVKFLKLFFKILLFLLVQLGMWLPALYLGGYAGVCLMCKIPLSNPVGLRVLWIGLAVLGVVGLIVSSYFKERQLREGDQKAAGLRPKPLFLRKKEKMIRRAPAEYGDAEAAGEDYDPRFNDYKKYSYDADYDGGIKNYTAPDSQSRYAVQIAAHDAPVLNRDGQDARITRPAPSIITAPVSDAGRILRGGDEERPLVFATRKDPNIVVLEYGDRLEYYLKPVDRYHEPRYVKTEYKGNL
jgi:hypothetical protein